MSSEFSFEESWAGIGSAAAQSGTKFSTRRRKLFGRKLWRKWRKFMFRIFGTDCDRSFGSIGIGSAPKTDRNKITEKEWFLENISKKETKRQFSERKRESGETSATFNASAEKKLKLKLKLLPTFSRKKESKLKSWVFILFWRAADNSHPFEIFVWNRADQRSRRPINRERFLSLSRRPHNQPIIINRVSRSTLARVSDRQQHLFHPRHWPLPLFLSLPLSF